jgi:integrase
MIFNAAVDDRRLLGSPFSVKTVRAPSYQPAKVVPWSRDQRVEFRANMLDRYKVTVDLGAGCGLRQGEIFAVSLDDIDSDRRILHVSRQIKFVSNRLIFALPKGGKTRDVPLPDSVARRLQEHAERYPLAVHTAVGQLHGRAAYGGPLPLHAQPGTAEPVRVQLRSMEGHHPGHRYP